MGAPADDDETSLVESAANGDAQAFAQLFHRYYSMIHAFAYRLCLDNAQAQDIAQETFIKAARSLRSFRRESGFKHWLYQIATNTSRDWRRKGAREAAGLTAWAAEDPAVQPAHTTDFSSVHDALAALPEELRRAVVLIYYEDMNHAQAAQILGCAETTISWRVFMAKRKLQRLLARPSAAEKERP